MNRVSSNRFLLSLNLRWNFSVMTVLAFRSVSTHRRDGVQMIILKR